MQMTQKQRDILRVIITGNVSEDNGRFCDVDIDEIIDRVDYSTTKQSIQFSLRSLISKGLVEKGGRQARRGRSRQTYAPTELANRFFGGLIRTC